MIKKRAHIQFARAFSFSMLLSLLFEVVFPTAGIALTSGPSQPEVQSFEPVGTSQMVDPSTGDFTYNIPLLDVDGYPINISYHSGITTDQEASWVGLGWNINPGVINRNMRGIPDDFNGEGITKEFNMKPNRTYGLTLGAGLEVIGLDKAGNARAGVGRDLTIRFNNYTGVGMDRSLSGHISLGKPGNSAFTENLGLTSSSDNGLTIQPSASFSARMNKEDKNETKMGLSIGCSFNSRAGLSSLTIGTHMSSSNEKGKENQRDGKAGNAGTSSNFNFGMPTYVPQLTLPYTNFSIYASFKLGWPNEALYPYARVAGYYSSQKLTTNSITNPAYGYLNADEGVKFNNSVMDFNREKDAPFNLKTPALAVPNFTYDILSVSGQGIGGSYRPFRSDFGQVFDPSVSNLSTSASASGETGVGSVFHLGIDVAVSHVNSTSGRWDNSDGSNAAHTSNYFTQTKSDPLYERYYYKEANEKSVDADPTFLQRAGGYDPKHYQLQQISSFNTKSTANFSNGGSAYGSRSVRERRSQSVSMLSRGEIAKFGLLVDSNLYSSAVSHHIAEITSTTPDGRRYVYGIAAYNTRQEETSFAVGVDEFGKGGVISSLNCNNGLISYTPGQNSISNGMGIDNYFNNTILPAYSHSFFLTSVLSTDYVDSDTIRGPSANDIGTYTKFNYTKTDANFRWRTPFQQNSASHNEGLKWTRDDDKASYVYGEKELWYLSSIETKNYVAIFSLENRDDGYGVYDKNGGLSLSHPVKLLRKISLYTQANYKAHLANPSGIELVPVKEVHFKYDYSLCNGVPNNKNYPSSGGKLTLKEIAFSYESSAKSRLSPYKFVYGYNPNYHIKSYDRWGNYKPQDANVASTPDGCNPKSIGLSNAEFPYVEQNKTNQDQYAAAWALDTIKLPSGGAINVDYESDDYAYVQNKRACQMFKIVGVTNSTTTPSSTLSDTTSANLLASSFLVIKLQNTLTGPDPKQQFYDQYLAGLGFIYFRFLYNMRSANGTYEYVPGYVPISELTQYGDFGVYPGGQYAYIRFNAVHINDNTASATISPITKAALQYGRLNEPRNVWQATQIPPNSNFGLQLLKSLVQSSFVLNITSTLQGPNSALYNSYNCCQDFILNKSWIRLNNPDQHRLGGGARVKRITVQDKWDSMTSGAMPGFSYGQEYSYDNEDGSSSGVAGYEPVLGGDENPWHTPVYFETNNLLAPNDENYLEEPFGEAFFPNPSVIYGRVTVQNIKYSNVKKHASGKIVHEFWTAKDFPTITSRTDLQAIREKSSSLSLANLFGFDAKDYMTASQGFYIELNDMHGKPKGQKVYQEGISTPISSVEYSYKKVPYQSGSFKLDNSATIIYPNGATSNATIGEFFDFVTDMRQHLTHTIGASTNFNTDGIYVVIGTIPIPTIWPKYTNEKTRFRSTASTKVVQRFGLLEKTIVKDLGSTVETQNLAYDSETGEVILTQTTNDFNDPVYTLNFPAYWYYDGMGPSYKNIGLSLNNVFFNSLGKAAVNNANQYFAPGDEIEMMGADTTKGWVVSSLFNGITVEKRDGTSPNGTYSVKVVRSGRRNMQSESMASISSLQNPINGLSNNIYEKVIAASGVEYNDQWGVFCGCFDSIVSSYINGSKGNWRKKRAFAYLTNRTQSNYDNNTNIRKDGVFAAFNPLYKSQGNHWAFDTLNWTFTSRVTLMNPNGQELENRDALGRYSAANYGYNQTLATAVAANSQYRELGFDNAEEYGSLSCADNHFKFKYPKIDSAQSHSGRKSLKVTAGTPLTMTKFLGIPSECNRETDNPCAIYLSNTPGAFIGGGGTPTNTIYSFSGTGATSPITISWIVLSGNPSVTLSGSTLSVPINSSIWSILVTVTGATGCSQSFQINNP